MRVFYYAISGVWSVTVWLLCLILWFIECLSLRSFKWVLHTFWPTSHAVVAAYYATITKVYRNQISFYFVVKPISVILSYTRTYYNGEHYGSYSLCAKGYCIDLQVITQMMSIFCSVLSYHLRPKLWIHYRNRRVPRSFLWVFNEYTNRIQIILQRKK